jgi:hypothetical protein
MFLTAKGADLNDYCCDSDTDSYTLLLLACLNEHMDAIQRMLTLGGERIDINKGSKLHGWTPLYVMSYPHTLFAPTVRHARTHTFRTHCTSCTHTHVSHPIDLWPMDVSCTHTLTHLHTHTLTNLHTHTRIHSHIHHIHHIHHTHTLTTLRIIGTSPHSRAVYTA